MSQIKICAYCGEEFPTNIEKKRFCTSECRKKSSYEKIKEKLLAQKRVREK